MHSRVSRTSHCGDRTGLNASFLAACHLPPLVVSRLAQVPLAAMNHDKRANAQQLAAQLLLVEHIDTLITAPIGYLVLIRLPRALARLLKSPNGLKAIFFNTNGGCRILTPSRRIYPTSLHLL